MSTLKHKGKGPQALTANELRSGLSVWLTSAMKWSRDYSDAMQTEETELMEMMQAKGEADEAENIVVGVYFIDIEPETGLPARYREKFRMRGPSLDTADLVEQD